jgi:Cu2+-exporting ATPase
VLVLAALSAVYWWPTNTGHALMVAVAVLVVTCPCALSLATPAAMLAAAGNLARHGVLVRNLQALESLAEIDTVIFDKTGTLTQDGQRITQVITAEGVAPEYALRLAAALAKHSLHPLSRALVKAQEASGQVDAVQAQDVNEMIGLGLEAHVDGLLRLGSAKFCAPKTKGIPDKASVCQVHLCTENEWLASWQLSEDVRADAVQTVQALKSLNLDVWLLSGDRPESAQLVAQEVGITQAFGACTPQDKLSRMQAAQSQGARVAMVGDGLNDGPVLAGAHVSMAFGNAVPLAQSKSDLVLMGGSLLVVAQSVKLARHTLRVVKQNLVWAAAYNALCVPLAVVGLLPAWLAGLGMALSSLWVVLNSLRLTKGF